MSTLGRAVIEFSAETARFTGDIGRTAAMFERNMLGMQRAVDGLLGKLGVAGGIAGLALMTKGAIDLADSTFKAGQKLGMTTEQVSELAFAFKLADVEQEAMVKGLGKFEVALVEAHNPLSKSGKLFRALGIDITEGPYKAFRKLADVMASLPKDSEITAAISKALLGEAGMEMIPGMLEGSAGFDVAAGKARALGVVIGEDFGRKAQEFNDNMKILETRSQSLGMSIAKYLLPVLGDVADKLARAAEAGRGAFAGEILQTIGRASGALVRGAADIAGVSLNAPLEKVIQDAFDRAAGTGPKQLNVATGRIGGMGGPMGPTLTPEQDAKRLRAIRDALASNDAAERAAAAATLQYESALAGLNKQIVTFNKEGPLALMLVETQTGSLKNQSPERKKVLLDKAAELRMMQLEVMARTDVINRINNETAARRGLDQVVQQFMSAEEKGIRDQKFEVSLIGVSAAEREMLTAMRRIDDAAQATLASLDPSVDEGAYADSVQRLEEFTKLVKSSTAETLQIRREAERDWILSAKLTLREYADAASNTAESVAQLVSNSFKTMEDALVEFAKTGKLNFRSLADSIVSDMLRIQIRSQITGPLAAAAEQNGGLWGLLQKAGGSLFSGGSGGAPSGAYDLASGAPLGAYASGTDYVPQTGMYKLHAGEAVIPASENIRSANSSVVINMNISTPDVNSFRASRTQLSSDMAMALAAASRRGT